jgi:2-polyprenyl-3-methyl-5-hydroxy-6-metoxy-1,4-benzoquinol methylase
LKQNVYITTKDYLVSGETFDLVLNSDKDILITSPSPQTEDLAKYYESDSYISHTDSQKGAIAFLYQKVKKHALKKKLQLVGQLQKEKGCLLDIGTGTGEFIYEAKKNGWKISGIEPNDGARNLAKKKGVHLENSIDAFVGQKFDVITLWHVLEHLPDLDSTLEKIESLLNENGTVLIAVPNYNSYDAKFYNIYWAAFDVPRHLWHFSQSFMKTLFSPKLKLVKTKPMLFDSFYVSLLSEKYKSGATFSLKAFFIGLWSNILAWRSSEYSSLIYCYKKQL